MAHRENVRIKSHQNSYFQVLRDYKLEWKGCDELDISTRLINRPKSDVSIKFIKRN